MDGTKVLRSPLTSIVHHGPACAVSLIERGGFGSIALIGFAPGDRIQAARITAAMMPAALFVNPIHGSAHLQKLASLGRHIVAGLICQSLACPLSYSEGKRSADGHEYI